jgi:cysteine desulfurase
MLPLLSDLFGNPSSAHGWGRQVRALVDEARQSVAALIGARASTLLFTSGGTEADNLALRGVAALHPGGHIVTTAIEHHAVLETARALEEEGLATLTVVPVATDGVVPAAAIIDAIRADTMLVSVMLANNETGALQPVEEVAAACRERRVLFHTDAVQAASKVALDVEQLGVDLLSLSAHKIGGPKGVGTLYLRRGLKLRPLHHGGSQERTLRPGTENVAGIVGFGAAARVVKSNQEAESQRLGSLRDRFETELCRRVDGIRINASGAARVATTSSLTIRDAEAEALLLMLDMDGIAISAGSACTTGAMAPSHVLTAMGLTAEEAHHTVRIAWGHCNEEADLDYLLARMVAAIEDLRLLAAAR